MNLKEAAQQALEYLEQHAIISGVPIRDALRVALEPVTACHELSKEGDKLSLPFNHFPDAGKMVATIRPEVTVAPVATISKTETVEPVAWTTKGQISAMENGFQHYIHGRVPRFVSPTEDDVPLYTAPPKRKPLTEEDAKAMWPAVTLVATQDIMKFVRAIERAHGIGGEE